MVVDTKIDSKKPKINYFRFGFGIALIVLIFFIVFAMIIKNSTTNIVNLGPAALIFVGIVIIGVPAYLVYLALETKEKEMTKLTPDEKQKKIDELQKRAAVMNSAGSVFFWLAAIIIGGSVLLYLLFS